MLTELRHGRRSRYPYTGVPHWPLLLNRLSHVGFRVYVLLLAHVNSTRGDGVAWPSQAAMGEMLGIHEDTVGKVINKELKPLGLIDVTTHRYGDNNTRKRNVYTIHEVPEADFEGVPSVPAWYQLSSRPGVNPQVTPDPVYTPGPEGVYAPGPEGVYAPGPEAAHRPVEEEEAKTKRNPPPPPSSGAKRRSDEDDEDSRSPLRGYTAQIQEEPEEEDDEPPLEVTSVDLLRAKALLEAIPWPGKRIPMGAAVRQRILSRMAELSAGGWTARDVTEYISGRVPDWKAVRRPADLVATLLADSPTRLREAFQEAPEPVEEGELGEARREHNRLAALLEQQRAMITSCGVCDEMGWLVPVGGGTMEWHGHGKMGLNVERNRAGRKLAQLEEAQSTDDQQVWEFAKG